MNELEKKWYMITTISGKEEQVIDSLHNRVQSEQLQDQFDEMLLIDVPTLSPKELSKKLTGQKFRTKMRNLFPGYIFIKMAMTNEAWFVVRNTQYVTGLVGSSGQRTKPTPISDADVEKMRAQAEKIKQEFAEGKIATPFVEGAVVSIIDGPHKGQIGPVIENNDEKGEATVEVILFNRKTPVTIEHKFLEIKSA